MSDTNDPFASLSRQELLWLAGILKDACRERLEKNLVSQAIEERLYQRGPVEGRSDPRPFLQIWEPRYRKFLEAATALHAALEAGEAKSVAATLRAQVAAAPAVRRYGPSPERRAMIEGNGANPRRKSRSR
jgi:hypothetical protein